jgi:hypothetical protein
MCKLAFPDDDTKKFKLIDDLSNEMAELTLSLDVIYHLIEDNVFADYMNRLFSSSGKFVIIYSTNITEENFGIRTSAHVKHRKFSNWIESNIPEWQLLSYIPNKRPFITDTLTGSYADFYVYKKRNKTLLSSSIENTAL